MSLFSWLQERLSMRRPAQSATVRRIGSPPSPGRLNAPPPGAPPPGERQPVAAPRIRGEPHPIPGSSAARLPAPPEWAPFMDTSGNGSIPWMEAPARAINPPPAYYEWTPTDWLDAPPSYSSIDLHGGFNRSAADVLQNRTSSPVPLPRTRFFREASPVPAPRASLASGRTSRVGQPAADRSVNADFRDQADRSASFDSVASGDLDDLIFRLTL